MSSHPNNWDRVPVGPFKEWLDKVREDGELDAHFAQRIDLKPDWLRSIRRGLTVTIPLDTVDRVLCHEGSTHLDELYPYEDDSQP